MDDPEFAVVGHLVKDITPDGWRLGGGVVYAGVQAHKLDYSVEALTCCSSSIRPSELPPGIRWHVLPSDRTTTFENVYVDGVREQRAWDFAEPIELGDIRSRWLTPPIVLISPVLGDVDRAAGTLFSEECLVGLGAQGWLRRLEGSTVRPGHVIRDHLWLTGDVVFVSEEDVDDPDLVESWRRHVPTIVLTRGANGCTLWDDSGRHDFPAFRTRPVDPTGAGDVFAAAFLIRLKETGDNMEAARFASAAASLVIQSEGPDSIGDRDEIEAVLKTGVSLPR